MMAKKRPDVRGIGTPPHPLGVPEGPPAHSGWHPRRVVSISAGQTDPGTRDGTGGVPTVLYLGGLGRSGTAVLERVLGELPGACSVGELVYLWERGVLRGETCGCG